MDSQDSEKLAYSLLIWPSMKSTLFLTPFILLILGPLAASAEDTGCFYASKRDAGDLVMFDDCGRADATGFVLSPEHKDNIRFGDDNLACLVFSKENAFWVHKNGRSVRTPYYDFWCDNFEDGLAIGRVDGREVYIDEDLDVVLDPGFESLGHFYYDFAVVCDGPFRYEQLGEHTLRKGGKCGMPETTIIVTIGFTTGLALMVSAGL